MYSSRNQSFFKPYKSFLECQTIDDCYGTSDTCHENICKCGSNAKCTGTTDTCNDGKCSCGNNTVCSGTEYCDRGECKGMSALIFTRTQLLFICKSEKLLMYLYIINFSHYDYIDNHNCKNNAHSSKYEKLISI